LGDGILKAKIVKGMYSLRLKFPGGWGMGELKPKKPSMVACIFAGTTHSGKITEIRSKNKGLKNIFAHDP